MLNRIEEAVQLLCDQCHAANLHWWKDNQGNDIRDNPLTFSNKLMLIVSECAESMEGDRKNCADTHLPHRPMREVELADALLRIVDLAAGYNLDLAGAVVEKMAYNAIRPDHTTQGRTETNGKQY